MEDLVGDIVEIPVALSYLNKEALKELDNATPSLLPCDVAVALNQFYELDFEKRSALIRTSAINALEDAIRTFSSIDISDKNEDERRKIQSQIEETQRLYTRAVRELDGDHDK